MAESDAGSETRTPYATELWRVRSGECSGVEWDYLFWSN